MQAFDYIALKSVDEVVSLLASQNGNAKILGGGTDLIVQLREGRRKTGLVVDIKHIPELTQVTYDSENGGLRIGAAAACHDIFANPIVQQKYPGLVDGIHLIGGVQIQSRARDRKSTRLNSSHSRASRMPSSA